MSRLHHLLTLTTGAVLVAAGMVAVGPGAAQAATGTAAAQSPSAAVQPSGTVTAPTTGRYWSTTPTRVFSGTVGTQRQVVRVAGRSGVPADATAVVLSVEVSAPTASGSVRVTPAGSDPTVTTQQFRARQAVTGLTTVALARGGVQVSTSAGSAKTALVVSGYYATGAGSTFTPLDTTRVTTATGVGGKAVRVPIAGRAGVPADATAVVATLGVTAATADAAVRITPAGKDASVATQSFRKGTPIAGAAVVGLSGGAAQVAVSKGRATVSVDVSGYYSRSTTGSVFVPVTPSRVTTTTVSSTPRAVRVTGISGVPGTATAVVATAAVSATTTNASLRLAPAGGKPTSASLVYRRGQPLATATTVRAVGSTLDRRVLVRVDSGSAKLTVDVTGYFLDGRSGSGIGADISWPQCTTPTAKWPSDQAFGVVGVNDGLASGTNPCLAQQLVWAAGSRGGTTQPRTQLYVNTANPGKAFKDDPSLPRTTWPTANVDPDGEPVAVPARYGICGGGTAGLTSLACSYVYGWNRAHDDVHDRGVPAGVAYRWWLDAETDGSWQTDQNLNRATLEGMTDMFRSTGGSVGLYSSPGEWKQLFGTVPTSSQLVRLPTWKAVGPTTLSAAQAACSTGAFTSAGRTEMVQYVAGGFDRIVSCV